MGKPGPLPTKIIEYATDDFRLAHYGNDILVTDEEKASQRRQFFFKLLEFAERLG